MEDDRKVCGDRRYRVLHLLTVMGVCFLMMVVPTMLGPIDTELDAVGPPVDPTYVYFDANGGTGGPTEIYVNVAHEWTFIEVTDFTLPEDIPVREGFTFIGWRFGLWTEDTPILQPGQSYDAVYGLTPKDFDTLFYAVWRAGSGTEDDPYYGEVDGHYSMFDGAYVKSGTTLHIFDGGSVVSDGFNITVGTESDYSFDHNVLVGTLEGSGTFTSGDGTNTLLTLNVIPDVTFSDLEFLSDPVTDGDITYRD